MIINILPPQGMVSFEPGDMEFQNLVNLHFYKVFFNGICLVTAEIIGIFYNEDSSSLDPVFGHHPVVTYHAHDICEGAS